MADNIEGSVDINDSNVFTINNIIIVGSGNSKRQTFVWLFAVVTVAWWLYSSLDRKRSEPETS